MYYVVNGYHRIICVKSKVNIYEIYLSSDDETGKLSQSSKTSLSSVSQYSYVPLILKTFCAVVRYNLQITAIFYKTVNRICLKRVTPFLHAVEMFNNFNEYLRFFFHPHRLSIHKPLFTAAGTGVYMKKKNKINLKNYVYIIL